MTKRGIKIPKGIRRKSNGRYIADVCIDGLRKTATCETLEEALKAQSFLKVELESAIFGKLKIQEMRENPPLRREHWTLKEACDYCIKTRWQMLRNKPSMYTKVNIMQDYFGNIKIDDITTRKVDDFIAHLLKTYKAGTVNVYLGGLSTVLRLAFDREMLDKLPKIPHIKNSAKRIRYLTEVEEVSILDYFVASPEMRDLIIVLLDTGMRKGEVFSLKRENIDLDRGLITVWKTKTDSPRSVPMTNRVREVIEMRINAERPINLKKYERAEHLFKLNPPVFLYHWEKMRAYLGFKTDPDFVPHMLRHTCCSRLVQRGAELVKVMKWMGHSNIGTTMIYAHLSPSSLLDIKTLLEM